MNLSIISTVGGGYSWAGSEEMWRMLAEQALAGGCPVRANIAASMASSGELEKFKGLGGTVTARPELNALTRRLAGRGLYSRFGDFGKGRDNMVVLSMGAVGDCLWMPDLLGCYWESKLPWMIIVQANGEHIVSQESHREILRRFYGNARRVIFVSHQNLELAERQLACRLTNAMVMPNPIRLRMDQPLPWPVSEDSELRFAEVARLEVFQKRQDQLLEALATAEWKARPWKLTFYGSGSDEGHIRSLIKHYGLENHAFVGEYVRDFREIWRTNHLHVFPTAYEGMPLAVIESMFCGRPSVVTRAGGNAELVSDNQEGFVSPGMHPEIIRETLERAWAARDRWQAMGLAAFARAGKVVPKDLAAQVLALVESAAAPARGV